MPGVAPLCRPDSTTTSPLTTISSMHSTPVVSALTVRDSAEAALRCQAVQDGALYELFCSRSEPERVLGLVRRAHSTSRASRLIDEYLRLYGARVPSELKLESESLADRPASLVALLQALLEPSISGQADRRKRGAIRRNYRRCLSPAKRALLQLLEEWAHASIRRREETRFRRALIFGHARKIFVALGQHLHAANVLAHPRDVFLLTETELFALLNGTLDPATAQAAVIRRSAEMQEWKLVEMPRRIECDGPLDELLSGLRDNRRGSALMASSPVLRGNVAAPSEAEFVDGVALVMPEFSPTASFQGKILVARYTDPGWTIVFPFVKAVVVERGGLLSHAAVVAREMGIPCIVGVEGATRVIQDGAAIQLSMATGEVRTRIDSTNDDRL